MKRVDFQLLKCLSVFPGKSAERTRKASRPLCKLSTLLDFLQQDTRLHLTGESPECLTGRWLPNKVKFGSSLCETGKKYPPSLLLFSSNSTKYFQQCTLKFTGTCGHVWIDSWLKNCIMRCIIYVIICFMSLKQGWITFQGSFFRHRTSNWVFEFKM